MNLLPGGDGQFKTVSVKHHIRIIQRRVTFRNVLDFRKDSASSTVSDDVRVANSSKPLLPASVVASLEKADMGLSDISGKFHSKAKGYHSKIPGLSKLPFPAIVIS